jgi:hypothetical protein
MTMAIEDLFTPDTNEEWLDQIITNAQTLELKTTAWQTGGMALTILAILSNIMAQEDGIVSIMAQGGFLDYAATGTVTYVALNGESVTQPVTPDPSIPSQNSTGAAGWLDVLASSVYNVTRIGAQYADGTQAFANTTASTYGPYAVGTYHVSNPTNNTGYTNQEELTIAAANIVGTAVTNASNTAPITITTSTVHGLTGTETVKIAGVLGNTAANGFFTISVVSTTSFVLNSSSGNGVYSSGGTVNVCTTCEFVADVSGPDGTSTPGTITTPVTVLSGVTTSNTESFFGAAYESNTQLAARCRLKMQALSPNSPKGAYLYFALTAYELLLEEDTPIVLSSPITRALKQLSATTGVITISVANVDGAVSGVANLAVTGATNATPIVITTATHGLSTGDYVTITGVIGNTNANGTWVVTVIGGTTFSLDGSSGNAAYSSGGIVDGGDLGSVDYLLQSLCVVDNQTEITQSATNQDVVIVGAATVPQAQVTAYATAVQVALALYISTLPIGGVDGYVPYDVIVGILLAAGSINDAPSYVSQIGTVTVGGASVDYALSGPTYVAVLTTTPVITVTGV